MTDVFTVLSFFALFLVVFLGRMVARFLGSRDTKKSEWFAENVGKHYVMEFPDKEREQFDTLLERLKMRRLKNILAKKGDEMSDRCTKEFSTPEAFVLDDKEFLEEFFPILEDGELALLLSGLKNWMMKSIENLARLQTDKEGIWRMWRYNFVLEIVYIIQSRSHINGLTPTSPRAFKNDSL